MRAGTAAPRPGRVAERPEGPGQRGPGGLAGNRRRACAAAAISLYIPQKNCYTFFDIQKATPSPFSKENKSNKCRSTGEVRWESGAVLPLLSVSPVDHEPGYPAAVSWARTLRWGAWAMPRCGAHALPMRKGIFYCGQAACRRLPRAGASRARGARGTAIGGHCREEVS